MVLWSVGGPRVADSARQLVFPSLYPFERLAHPRVFLTSPVVHGLWRNVCLLRWPASFSLPNQNPWGGGVARDQKTRS